MEHSIVLLLVFLMVLNLESFGSAEVFSLCFSSLELVISFIELTGGVNMESINIVVGIGCYGGRPNNRANIIRLKAIP